MAITFTKSERKHIDFALTSRITEGVVWELPYGLDEDPEAINICLYPTDAIEITLADVEYSMPDGMIIWRGSLFYKKGWGASNTLEELVPGVSYIVIVPTACIWEIPQPEPEPDLDRRLKSGEIGANWWSYSQSERLSYARYAIENYSTGISIRKKAEGQADCAGEPYTDISTAVACYKHFLVRFCRLGNSDLPTAPAHKSVTFAYWQDPQGIWHCLYCPDSFKLPIYEAIRVRAWFSSPDAPFHIQHSMCALQVRAYPSDFDSWIFFQYGDTDIKPGAPVETVANMMKEGDLLVLRNITHLRTWGHRYGDEVYCWEITRLGAEPTEYPTF